MSELTVIAGSCGAAAASGSENWLTDGGLESIALDTNNLTGWVTIQGSETLNAETDAPIAGARSGKITTSDGSTRQGVIWFTDESGTGFPVTPGDSVRVAVTLHLEGTGSVRVDLDCLNRPSIMLAEVTAPGDFVIDETIAIPSDAPTIDHATVIIQVTGAHASLVIRFDDVFFGPA